MAAERQVIDGEKVVNLDDEIGELAEQLADVRRRKSAIEDEEKSLVEQLKEALGVNSSQRVVLSSVAGTVNGVPVVSASSFTRTSVDGSYLRRHYPEIYSKCVRRTAVTTVRTQGDSE